jgi:2'-hydroxyisoflavone reductase
MRLLIVGGTIFLGRHLEIAAQSRDHEVTLFSRGQNNPHLYPDIEKLRWDRDGILIALQNRIWDTVIDICGYLPCIDKASAELLAHAVDHCTFISSTSVYADIRKPIIDELGMLGVLERESVEEISGRAHRPHKILCEQTIDRIMPGRSLNIRPGLIVGPHDLSGAFALFVAK